MLSFKQAYQEVEEFIAAADFSGNPAELYDPITYSMNLGGKRLRPALLLMAADIFEAEKPAALNAALGIEVFHNFTLVHDDIMDEAPLRRGKDTVYKKWNRDIAILSGDVMFVKAIDFFLKLQPAQQLADVLRVFNKTAAEVCDGQQMDMNFETQEEVSIADYIQMIELKTAVLLAAALKIGAMIGGASDEDANHIYEFGRFIGIAFQLQDDYLDAYANPDTFGKIVGGDIIANKKTYLLLEAFNLANTSQLAELNDCISGKFEGEEKVKRVKSIYNQLTIPELSKQKMKTYFDQGRDVILVGGHYNNWEMLAVGINQIVPHDCIGIYTKLSNPFFDDKMKSSRSKFGLKMINTREVTSNFIKKNKTPRMTIFGADQSPTYSKNVHWTNFLNQDTAVALGTERFAKKYNLPVVFCSINKEKRGIYSAELSVLTENPQDTEDGEITEMHTSKLENQINVKPEFWLWTHKRWKRKR